MIPSERMMLWNRTTNRRHQVKAQVAESRNKI